MNANLCKNNFVQEIMSQLWKQEI